MSIMKNDDRLELDYPGKEQVLYSFAGLYDCSYVILHPFPRIEGLGGGNQWRTGLSGRRTELRSDLFSAELKSAVDIIPEDSDGLIPIDIELYERLEKQAGEEVSWAEFGRSCDVTDPIDITHGLNSYFKICRNEALSSKVEIGLNNMKVFTPMLGGFPVLLENKILSVFEFFGLDNLVVSDWLNDKIEHWKLFDTSRTEPWAHTFYSRVGRLTKIYDVERQILFVVDIDSFSSLVCFRTEAQGAKIDVTSLFEGFWCDATTKGYWWHRDANV